jgi:hypothetical protein
MPSTNDVPWYTSKAEYASRHQSISYLNILICLVQYCDLHTGPMLTGTGRSNLHVSGTLSCTVRFPVRCKRLFTSHKRPDRLCCLPSLLQNGNQEHPPVYRGSRVKLTNRTLSNADIENAWNYTSTLPHQGCTNFPKIYKPPQNSRRARMTTSPQFHTDVPHH